MLTVGQHRCILETSFFPLYRPADVGKKVNWMAKRKTPPTRRKRKAGHLRAGGISLDLKSRSVTKGKVTVRLTPKGCALLQTFMKNGGIVLTRKFLMKEVWDTDWTEDTRTLDVHVRWLRQKIEDNPSKPVYLRTVRGVGYRFEAPA